MAFSSSFANDCRDLASGRIGSVRLFDDGGTQRYSQGVQVKNVYDRRIEVYQTLNAAEGNGFNLVRVELWSNEPTPRLMADETISLDKRVSSPLYNLTATVNMSLLF